MMDLETVDAVLHAISHSCREEVERALDEPAAISGDCKLDIRTALARTDVEPSEANPNAAPPPPNQNTAMYYCALALLICVVAAIKCCRTPRAKPKSKRKLKPR